MKQITLEEIKEKLVADSVGCLDIEKENKMDCFNIFVDACGFIEKRGLNYTLKMFDYEKMEGVGSIIVEIEKYYCVEILFKDFNDIIRMGVFNRNIYSIVPAIVYIKA